MHETGYVHRDLKVENILVHYDDNHPVFKLADFGSAVPKLDHLLDYKSATK